MYHTVVIGGGCLGAATAISIQRKLNDEGKGEKVCLLEKAVLCAAESSRHSGIVRSANADPDASMMASISTEMWKNLRKHWGIEMELDEFGAIWIAKKNSDGENPAWNELSHRMKKIDLVFEEIKPSDALKKCGKEFAYCNIILDQEVMQDLPSFKDWPTFPQLYIKGELIGGCDITLELFESGELKKMIDEATGS